jgi:hypothetical protein
MFHIDFLEYCICSKMPFSLLLGPKVLLSLSIHTVLLPFAIATQCNFTDGSLGLAELQP